MDLFEVAAGSVMRFSIAIDVCCRTEGEGPFPSL